MHQDLNNTYTKAPITQAILELRLPVERSIKLELTKKAANQILAEGLEQIQDFSEHVAELGGGVSTSSSRIIGKEISSADERISVRCLVHSFAFIQKSPYRDWWYFEHMARKYWKIFSGFADVEPVRIGLRFINEFSIAPNTNINEYFNYYPLTPAKFPRIWESFVSRIQVPYPDSDYHVGIVIHSLPTTDATGKVALDIDVYADSPGISENDIWTRLQAMRAIKNEVFEEVITDVVREGIR